MDKTAIIGAGVIGASWAALFLAAGKQVDVFEPADNGETKVRDYVANAWPVLDALGLTANGNPDAITFHADAGSAVREAQFVQESVPEKIEIKHAIYAEFEPHLQPNAIVSSSASGLTLTEMQAGWKDPSRFVLGHPFNPPHLIPLVEVMGNERTADGVLEQADTFYEEVGKTTIRVNKEVPGHVSNRLQAALWREAIHLVAEGVATVEDVDKAVWAGPGLRWAAMGPHMLFNLAAGPGGMEEFCKRYGPSFHRWWEDMGTPEINEGVAAMLVAGLAQAAHGKDVQEMARSRDQLIVAMQNAMTELR
ncbi:MAG: 3-hydroxyacyl-CoA dehydrogenase NAD-binding domain-containing protein [Hyphomicrobiales bacterium]